MKVGFISLGCAKNLVDTEVMLGILRENGMELTPEPAEAEILIVNTCAFIETAKQESITTILNLEEYKKTGCCQALIAAGCLGQRYDQAILDEMPEVDAILGTGAFPRVMEAVREALAGNRVILAGPSEIIYDARMPRIVTTPSYTAYVKIAEGCDNRCAFCAIPLIRGHYRSRPMEDIRAEVERLAADGVKEINLIAQDTTNYGRDLYGEPRLAALLRELCRVEGIQWIRNLYAYPRFFTDELIDTIAREPKICKYVDLPLQHADDDILRAMRRPTTRRDMEALLKKIRERIPSVAIRSTFIVGFPGETAEKYETLRRFVEEQRFDQVGVFTYSQEDGTPAAALGNQIGETDREERYHDLMSRQSKISEELGQSLVGHEIDVLIEGRDAEEEQIAYGRSYREAPDVDGKIYIEGDADSQPGDIVRARIVEGFAYDLVAEPARS
ncbi:MAG: 30S ribosomal protein S12 methylthiotransferase RimO [Schwartzia sp.]|nr:30S ribosomal protein S12 methylthiotransferase RimO [Schwartzia sp. (in: firmicutes)]